MIRRVTKPTSAHTGTAPVISALPPGTPAEVPLQQVLVIPARAQVGMIPCDALVTSDGRQVYASGKGRWGQLYAAGTRP